MVLTAPTLSFWIVNLSPGRRSKLGSGGFGIGSSEIIGALSPKKQPSSALRSAKTLKQESFRKFRWGMGPHLGKVQEICKLLTIIIVVLFTGTVFLSFVIVAAIIRLKTTTTNQTNKQTNKQKGNIITINKTTSAAARLSSHDQYHHLKCHHHQQHHSYHRHFQSLPT